MAKGNITNVLPMILIGGWINWHYSGFITSKVALMYTLRIRKLFLSAQESEILKSNVRSLTNYLVIMAANSGTQVTIVCKCIDQWLASF